MCAWVWVWVCMRMQARRIPASIWGMLLQNKAVHSLLNEVMCIIWFSGSQRGLICEHQKEFSSGEASFPGSAKMLAVGNIAMCKDGLGPKQWLGYTSTRQPEWSCAIFFTDYHSLQLTLVFTSQSSMGSSILYPSQALDNQFYTSLKYVCCYSARSMCKGVGEWQRLQQQQGEKGV